MKLNIKNHTGIVFSKKLQSICKKLFHLTGIEYFCYQRRYRDNSYTFMTSNPHIAECFNENHAIENSWVFSTPFEELETGYSFWNISKLYNKHNAQQDITVFFENEAALPYGVDLLEAQEEFCDFYCFASGNLKIYQCPIHLLKEFVFYFKQECFHMLHDIWNDRFNVPTIQQEPCEIPMLTFSNELSNNFNIKKYHIYTQDVPILLTMSEVTCLKLTSKGYTAKEVAKAIGISYRTVEKHLENIRFKSGCANLLEVMCFTKEANII